ncbi:MAG TPA: DUF1707 domain-containing protein [Solirubrobacteraceae bacterium]|nr:DUF1707 domain-containing protein [Solirubrobacteraceae bacterium]
MNAQLLTTHGDSIRASDADRDKALGLLREHWLAGRLALDEYEERCGDAAAARFVDDLRRSLRELPFPLPEHASSYPAPAVAAAVARPAKLGTAIASVVSATLALLALIGSFGMLFLLTLPASTWAWALGRRARRSAATDVRVLGTVGEVLGIIATVAGCLALSACAVIITAL